MSAQEVRGAEITFDEFVTATAGRLLRTAVFLVYDRHLAEDLLQTAYERVARRWKRIAAGNPEAYARRVLVNLAIDENKRRARRRDFPAGSVADVERLAGAPPVAGAAGGDLDEVLRGLPPKQRAVVVLRYWCDLGEHEIAETLGISRGTVKSHTARAMTALREHLREGRADGR
ncbi:MULTISPECIES: SigE family RNA polymerase sigma factor [Thermomonosporaceae]|uniref:SigE family RNA polymerase sigma factor n=1 Tax=Thermomonosporaceae TaxID=2012 RepID=UPI00255A7EE2|nr:MULTISPECIES: SigE family RNA polymerase sigma factor [Thermomonosporaceae]MDL4775660.1 SigE family RNA polymerase sigma factor [Actinomadura xylanilytica]